MTVNTDVSSASYTGNGSTTSFTVPFYFLVDTDVVVTHKTAAGVVSTWVLNSDYTLAGAGNVSGGTMIPSVVLPAGDTVYIERNVDAVQQTEYPNNGPFPASSHERALDRLTMLIQQVLNKLTFGLFRNPLTSTYDAGSNTISNVADAVNPQDVPSLAQTQTLVAGAASGLLPADIALNSNLASTATGKGSKLVAFIQRLTGAVGRTLEDKAGERVSAEDFGAVGDGVADDTAAINAAIAALTSGGEVFLPGAYLVSGPIGMSINGVTLRGKNWNTSKIVSTNSAGKIIDITADQCGIDNLSIEYSGTIPATTAAQAIAVTGQNVTLTNFRVQNAGVCAYFSGSTVAHISNFQLVGFSQAGLYFDNWIDAYVSQFAIQANVGSSYGQLGGIYATNSQAITACNADILSGAHAISLVGSSAYNFFVNIYCDSTYQDALYVGDGGANLTKFTNCWFSGGRFGAGFAGANLITCDGIGFVNCTFANNGSHGAFVGVAASRVSFDTCRIESNCITAASGTAHGISLDTGASTFSIRGCTIRNGYFGTRQGYGIFFNGGASDQFIIRDNILVGNATGAINSLPSSTYNWIVDDSNIGYKKPFIAATLSGTWTNYGGNDPAVGYIKDSNGFVHLQGTAKSGTIPSVMFTLPAGYVPADTHNFAANSNGAFGWVFVDATGNVTVQSGSNTFVSLAGLSFKAA